ncbi:multi-sensor signal transduction histidine kinase [Lunatimonas lonarensis]|uniref:histidine kinase n=2 Tax=Lunatimonas lonarensis TaxID=1232681 RepID=R7ZPZ7_9BACT|nr:multi-sensor signal transduction histidine kinase [Lunatimonas lonarensis]
MVVNANYSSFFALNPFPSWVYDPSSLQLMDVNQAALDLFGFQREVFLGLNLRDLICVEECASFLNAHDEVKEFGVNACLGVFTHRKHTGGSVRLEIHVHKVETDGRCCFAVTGRDVTQQESSELRLRDFEEKLKALSAMAKIGYWRMEADGVNVYWTDEVYRIFGKNKDRVELNFDRLAQSIHPDDREMVDRERDAVFAGERELDVVFRIILDEGGVKWVYAIGRLERSDNGTPIACEGTVQDITEQKGLELRMARISEELRKSEHRFKAVQEISPDGFSLLRPCRDKNGKVVDFTWIFQNKAIEKINGIDSNEIVGRNLLELFPSHRETPLFSSYVEVANSGVSKIMEEVYAGDLVSTPTWLRIVVVPLAGDIAILSQNITDQKVAQEKLRASEAKYRTIFDIASVGIAQADPRTGRITLVNSYYETITGYSQAELYAMNFKELTHPDDRQRDWEIYSKAARGEAEYKNEKRYVRKDGSIVWVRLHVVFVRDEEGAPILSVAICEEITERKTYEQQLLALNDSLKKYAHELEQSNAELEQFAFITSHDLQEPLRMISSFMDQLKRKYGDQLDEKANQYIHFASDGAKRMKRIVVDLLEYSRAGKCEDSIEYVDLAELVADYQLLRRKVMSDKFVKLNVAKLPTVKCCKAPLIQALHCLLDNAINYSKPGESPVISIQSAELEGYWEISISDQGIGIAPENHERIFVIFQRLNNQQEYAGTGIGLSIAKKQVESWGGKIRVESTLGEGSTFYFTIPKG